MTLLGPSDASNFRVKVGRYGDRWYTDPLPGCDVAPASDWTGPSVSTTKPPFANRYVTLKAIADMPTLAGVATSGPDDIYEAFKVHDKKVGRINMTRGTIVHRWAEDRLLGRTALFDDPGHADAMAQAVRFRPALDSFFDTYQPEPVAVECVCLHQDLNGVGYGGTADAFLRIEGEVWAVDWKSRNSDHGAYLEEAAQGGAYIGAQYMIVAGEDGQPKRVPIPDVAGVLIVSIREDGFRVFPIAKQGAVDAYHAMHAWWTAQRKVTDDKVIGKPWPPRSSVPAPPLAGTDHSAGDAPSIAAAPPPAAEPHTARLAGVAGATPGVAQAPGVDLAREVIHLPEFSEVPTTDRRAALMARYWQLSDDDQKAYRAKKIPKDDLDAIEAALTELDAFSVVVPLTPTVRAIPANRPKMPIASELDEGGVRPRADFEPMVERHKALEQSARSWVKNLIEESRGASVPIAPWPKKDGTRRGYHLLDGVITLAEGGHDDDEMVRELAATAADSDAPYFAKTAGQAVGILSVNEALLFATLCAVLCADVALLPELRARPAA
jgi:hypothetical protein